MLGMAGKACYSMCLRRRRAFDRRDCPAAAATGPGGTDCGKSPNVSTQSRNHAVGHNLLVILMAVASPSGHHTDRLIDI
jgi:hypothetical protein